MASPEIPAPEYSVEIDPQHQILLARSALDVVHLLSDNPEVLIGFQRLMRESQIEGIMDANAFDVSYDTFSHIGRLLQKYLQDERDLRSVKLRSDYIYRVVFDPVRASSRENERSIRKLGFMGNSRFSQHRGR